MPATASKTPCVKDVIALIAAVKLLLLGAKRAGNRFKTGSIPTQTGEPMLEIAAMSRSAAWLRDCFVFAESEVGIVIIGSVVPVTSAP